LHQDKVSEISSRKESLNNYGDKIIFHPHLLIFTRYQQHNNMEISKILMGVADQADWAMS
jgi:hypothetical protein